MEEPDILIEFLDCEKIWKQITPIEQNFASDLSRLIWENDENSLDEIAADSRFTNLQRMGILLISDNGPKFVSHFMFYYALCQYQISSNNFIAKSTPDILTDMKQIRRDFSDHTFKDYQNVLSYIFIVLINNYQGHDITLDLASDTITNDEYWFFFESINIAIPLLDLNAKDFVTFLVGVSERIGRDLASGSFYRAVYKLGYRKPGFALDLIDKYISLGNWQAVAILEHLLLGTSAVSSEYLKNSIRLGEEWVNSEIEKLQQVGLYYLLDLSLELVFRQK